MEKHSNSFWDANSESLAEYIDSFIQELQKAQAVELEIQSAEVFKASVLSQSDLPLKSPTLPVSMETEEYDESLRSDSARKQDKTVDEVRLWLSDTTKRPVGYENNSRFQNFLRVARC